MKGGVLGVAGLIHGTYDCFVFAFLFMPRAGITTGAGLELCGDADPVEVRSVSGESGSPERMLLVGESSRRRSGVPLTGGLAALPLSRT